MATPHKLTLVPYLQRWDPAAGALTVRVLVTPAADPLGALVPGAPAFADAALAFAVRVAGATTLPQRDLVVRTIVLPDPTGGQPTVDHPDARAIFTAIKQALAIPDGPAGDTFAPRSRDTTVRLRKYLPRSYRQAFGFVRPRTSLAVVDDTYHCLMRCPPPSMPTPAPTVVGWGEAIAFALRRPRLAEALGLVVELTVPLGELPVGGWLWVDLADAGDYAAEAAATPGLVRGFATRVPALAGDTERPVFTPVLLPVSADAAAAGALGNLDKVLLEAQRFDDGFAKIVHARQPRSADPLDEDGAGPPLARDEGVYLGWDDEDLLEGQNRALGAPPEGEDPVLAPRGILGYRVDVREEGTTAWTSLSDVRAPLDVGVDLGTAPEARWSEVAPAQHGEELWLPAWFVRWRGGSLVVDDVDEQRLMDVPPGRPEPAVPVGHDAVDLRYGRRYEFRVRLADTTGGGPGVADAPGRPGERPVALLALRRHRRPSLPAVERVTPPADGRLARVRLRRPGLAYPEAVFAAGAPARAALLAQIAANDAGDPVDARVPAIPDPDVAVVEIRVLVRPPAFDPQAGADGFAEWYRTTRRFPTDPTQPLEVALSWHDAADHRTLDVAPQLGAEGAVTGPVTLVTARDLRLELRALGRTDLTYFADDDARRGPAQFVDLHAPATEAAEADLVRPLPPVDTLRSVFLAPDVVGERGGARPVVAQSRPSPLLLARFAEAADLVADGSSLLGRLGERLVVACAGLAHHAAPDGSSLELADPAEMAGRWCHALQVVLDRDWTWRGAGSPGVLVTRTLGLLGTGTAPTLTEVVAVELMPTVSPRATVGADRDATRVVVIDAFSPPLGPDGLPTEVEVTYTVTVRLAGGGSVERSVTSRLPVATPPAQTPEVVAAGVALSPYAHAGDYSATEPRRRHLWLEMREPPRDRRDAYFARVLASAPDPMLLPGTEPVADPPEADAGPLDPEPVRVITPGQATDLAGLSTMQRLEPATDSDRHYLLPLPPNVDPASPELFSLFTYELRVGHDRGPAATPWWSTARARFGDPVVLGGVAHPPPELTCAVFAEPAGAVRVRAPFATPYLGLARMLPARPATALWAVVYARVVQADGLTQRNIPLARRELLRVRNPGPSTPLAVEGETRWTGEELRTGLREAGLPLEAPLGALAVELLGEPNGSFRDPLGGDLGQVRILRTSPLRAVERDCCAP